MKYSTSIILLLIIFISARSQTIPVAERWSYGTSYLVPAGTWESGLFQPLRFGLNQRMEVSSNILEMPLLPNAGIKVGLGERSGFTLASQHILSIPSVFLNTVSRKGTGGLLSPEFNFPFILGLNNSLIASRPVFSSALISFEVTYVVALRSGKVDPLATIDLPLFYPRMAQYYKGTSIRLASALKGSILPRLHYQEGFQVFVATRKESNFHAENSGGLLWAVGHSLRIKGGYILTYGKYPFGNHWQLWPTFDLIFGSKQVAKKK
jgi:hypothetical protein